MQEQRLKTGTVQKIHFISGKGGVGKSVLAASLAIVLAKKAGDDNAAPILLAELNERSFYQDYLRLQTMTYSPQKWREKLDISLWSATDCLKEYALHLLKVESLYKLFFENPISKALINVAPGLQEIAILGKATSSPRKHGPAMNYSQIVIDAFSSGHFLSLLRAPVAMQSMLSFGPMAEQSRTTSEWIRNPQFTQIHLVTLIEDLPLTETLELAENLKSEFGLMAHIYLNKVYQISDSDLTLLPPETKKYFSEQVELQSKARVKLKKSGFSFTEIPLITTLDSTRIVESIAEGLSHDSI